MNKVLWAFELYFAVMEGAEAKLYLLLGHWFQVNSAAISPDGRPALTGGVDNVVRVWDLTTGREIRRLGGHFGGVPFVAFSSDGRLALTGSRDRTARLWELSTGQEICEGESMRRPERPWPASTTMPPEATDMD